MGTIIIFKTSFDSRKETLRGRQKKIFELISPKGEITEKHLVFKWNPLPETKEYEVQLMNEELIKIWISKKIPHTTIKFPQDLYQKITKNKIYYWKVIAYLDDGSIIKSGVMEKEFPFLIKNSRKK